jgi:hypothetical protein
MAKKKKSKKHSAHHARSQQVPAAQSTSTAPVASAPAVATVPRASKPAEKVLDYEVGHLGHVVRDVRRVMVLGLSFVVAELVLWLVLDYTSVGSHVYGLIKL